MNLKPDWQSRWFLLGLCFLVLNAWGLWQFTRRTPAAAPSAHATSTQSEARRPALRLERVEQVNLSPERVATLVLTFNMVPDRDALPRYLTLKTGASAHVSFTLANGPPGASVQLETGGPVMTEQLEITIKAGLPAREGGLGLAEEAHHVLTLKEAVELSRLTPECPAFAQPSLSAFFTADLDIASAPAFLSVEPAVRYTVEPISYWGSGLRLAGDFKPGQVYAFTFRAGLKSSTGQTLSRDLVRQVQFPNRPPSLAFANTGRYLAPSGALLVSCLAMNLRAVEISAQPVLPVNLLQLALRQHDRSGGYFWNDSDKTALLTGAAAVITNQLPERMNTEIPFNADLRALAGPKPRGAYLLQLRRGDPSREVEDSQLVVVTDLGISACKGADGILVWVTSLGQGRPAPGAAVTLYAENNRELAHGVTDTNGLLSLRWTPQDRASPYLLTAALGDDLTYLELDNTSVSFGESTGGRAYLQDGYEAFVFTDRGVYRPGESVHIKALVRDGQMRAPPPFPVLLRIVKPDGKTWREFPLQLDELATTETNAVLPAYLPTGTYQAELSLPGSKIPLGAAAFALEDFVPPQIRAEIRDQPARSPAGAAFTFDVLAHHLFGRAAEGLKVVGTVSFDEAPFAPSAWREYRFGDAEQRFDGRLFQLGQVLLDGDGRGQFRATPSADWRPRAAIRAMLGATVIESNGRAVSTYGTTLVDVYPFYVGLKPAAAGGAARVGEEQRVHVIEVLPDGRLRPDGKPLIVRLSRVNWNTVLKRRGDGRYAYETERILTTVKEDTLAVGAAPVEYRYGVEGAGEYVLAFRDAESEVSSSLSFSASTPDQQWVSWDRENPDRMELAFDRERYRPGDKARLRITSPFSGQALLTILSDRVREQRTFALERNSTEVEIDVKDGYAPNVYAAVSVIRPAVAESLWTAHRAYGAVALKVVPPNRALTVAIDAPGTNAPQQTLHARLTFRDEQDRPVACRATVFAVDEGICMLTDMKTPDPLAFFLGPRALGSAFFDVYGLLLPVADAAADGAASHAPGDAGDSLKRRLNPIQANRFKPVALWAGTVQADSSGSAEVDFAVPEFSGELRLMAVAYDAQQVGSAAQPVRIKRGLVVQPSLARFLAPGDSSALSIQLFNESGADRDVAIRVSCGGPLSVSEAEVMDDHDASGPGRGGRLCPAVAVSRRRMAAQGLRGRSPSQESTNSPATPAERTLSLKAGESRRETLSLQAGPAPGKAICSLRVSSGAEQYAEDIELAVRPAAAAQSSGEFFRLAAGETREFALPTNLVAASVFREVWCSAQPEIRLSGGLDYLLRYPYGCVEQTVSGAFPLLYLSDLANRLRPQSMGREEPDALLRAAVLRVLSMQTLSGAFALWPFSTVAYPWGSLYATHFLVEADKADFSVPQESLAGALAYLRSLLDAAVITDASPDNAEWQSDMERRAYAAYILALAGKPDRGWLARLREEAPRLRFSARIHVAAGLMLAGDPRTGGELLDQLGLPPNRPREMGGALGSPVRDAALLLSTWLDLDPAHPSVARLAQMLDQQQEDGRWPTTQDNAMALLALGKYAQRVPSHDQTFSAKLLLPDGQALPFDHRKIFKWNSGESPPAGAITVRNDGPGRLYAMIRTQGVPQDGAVPEADHGLKVRREFLTVAGEPADPSTLAQGDLIVVKIALDPLGRTLDNIAAEDLLPAGWEIENPNLATAENLPWLKAKSDWCQARNIRDDRLVLFTGRFSAPAAYFYTARAVTPGRYTYPAITASCMYDPSLRSTHGARQVTVTP